MKIMRNGIECQATADEEAVIAGRQDMSPPMVEPINAARMEAFTADPDRIDMIHRLKTATPGQIDAYIEANLTNLAQARSFLKKLTKVLATIARD